VTRSAGRVVATPLGRAFDLLAAYEAPDGCFFEREGIGVSASLMRGGLRFGPHPDLKALARSTSAALRELHQGEVAPLAIGALGFDAKEASLSVPARAVVRADAGETWLLDLVGDDDPPPFTPERVIGDLPHEAFRPMQLTEEPSTEIYAAAVSQAVASIARGDLDKVVLARTLRVDANRALDARRLLHRLRAVEPHCFTFAAPTRPPATGAVPGVLVGASPELLVSRRGERVRSTPLAGTAPRAGDPDEDLANAEALAGSAKNREEHSIVVEAVAAVLGGFCDGLVFDDEPVLEPTANVWHLATRFEGTLRDPSVSALDIVAELHPTPAVEGLELGDRRRPRRRRLGDRAEMRCPRRRARDALRRGRHRGRVRPGERGRRDRAQVQGVPRLAPLGLSLCGALLQPRGRLARAARRVSPSRPSSIDASASCRPACRSPHGSVVTEEMRA